MGINLDFNIVIQQLSILLTTVSTGFFFLVLGMPKIIDVGSIERFKNFRDKGLLKYFEMIDINDIKKKDDDEKLKQIREEIYPLTAFVSVFENFLEKWDRVQNNLCWTFVISSIFLALTIFFPLNLSPFSFLDKFILIVGIEFLFLGIIMFFKNLKSQNKFKNDINQIELGEKSIEELLNEKREMYKKMLKKRKIFY